MNNQSKCFIIAELSANHNGDLAVAIETIKAAKRAGADAIKLQTYTAETMTIDSEKDDFVIKGGTIWDGKNLFNLYQEAYTPWEWHQKLFDTAKEEGLICFSTPFDFTAVDFLESLNNPIYKIASFEIQDIPLIEYCAKQGKPMIMSTGIAEKADIELAIQTCRDAGNNDITILKCTSSYPAPIEEANLAMMAQYAEDFDVKVGLSDHTLGVTVPVVAAAMGASVIEKHIILDRSIGGPDASFSLNEIEFKEMVDAVRATELAMGKVSYDLTPKQSSGKKFARSLYFVEDIKAGELFTAKNIRAIRPGFGIHPKHLKALIGKSAKADIERGTAVKLSDLND